MILDDLTAMQQLDASRMIDEIDHLPDQLENAARQTQSLAFPNWGGVQRIVIAGMGGSAIAGDLISSSIVGSCPVPVMVHRDYGLPAWANSAECLVICCSHSGNTEETLSSFATAQEQGCRVAAITTGGQLRAKAESAGYPVWIFQHNGQPRSAIGYGFAYLAGIFTRLGLANYTPDDFAKTAAWMRQEQQKYLPATPVVNNPAKRQAGQMVNRNLFLFASGQFAPVARRWKGQINELAKAPAAADQLPEADHNSLAGSVYPPELLEHSLALFIQSASDHPANLNRSKLTRRAYMLAGIPTDHFTAAGETPLQQLWSAIHYGDYISYYLAMLYGVDPTPIDAIQDFKKELSKSQ
jgi:glucose/mannose-6-phosphate isomerase